QETSQPVQGRIYYVPRPDNPHIADLPEFNSHNLPGPQFRYQVDENGNYRVVGAPGRGYVGLWALGARPFPAGQGLKEIADLPSSKEFANITSLFQPHAKLYTIVKEVRVGENEEQATADLEVSPGERMTVDIVDDEGKPLGGATVYGLWPRNLHHVQND